ncbi:MAG: hypothetical protein IKK43_01105 [Clostridia bacterium]|nr:hypothetical protein [Clostridia bacterium]
MAWFNKSNEENKYVLVTTILKERYGRFGDIKTNYSMKYRPRTEISYDKVDAVLKKFIEKIDDESFVTLREFEREPYDSANAVVGGPVRGCNGFYFYILKEDISKIETDEPIHVLCMADAFPDDREEFLDMVKLFCD